MSLLPFEKKLQDLGARGYYHNAHYIDFDSDLEDMPESERDWRQKVHGNCVVFDKIIIDAKHPYSESNPMKMYGAFFHSDLEPMLLHNFPNDRGECYIRSSTLSEDDREYLLPRVCDRVKKVMLKELL